MDVQYGTSTIPKVIRSTIRFQAPHAPFVYAEDLHETLETLKQKKVRLFAAHF